MCCRPQQIAGIGIVRAINHQIMGADQRVGIAACQARLYRFHRHARVQRRHHAGGLHHLGGADAVGGMQDLAVEIADLDMLIINKADMADTGSRQIEPGGRAKPASPDKKNARCQQAFLPLFANVRHDRLSGIAFKIGIAEH